MRFGPDSWWRRWVFGLVLPWAGWETWPCHWDGEPMMPADPHEPEHRADHEADFVTVEWLWVGLTLMRGAVRPVDGVPRL